MVKINYREIRKVKVQKFKSDTEKKIRWGLLIGGIFYDISGFLRSVKKEEKLNFIKNVKKELLRKSEKIIDKPTKQVTHLIISILDLEKLNFRR